MVWSKQKKTWQNSDNYEKQRNDATVYALNQKEPSFQVNNLNRHILNNQISEKCNNTVSRNEFLNIIANNEKLNKLIEQNKQQEVILIDYEKSDSNENNEAEMQEDNLNNLNENSQIDNYEQSVNFQNQNTISNSNTGAASSKSP